MLRMFSVLFVSIVALALTTPAAQANSLRVLGDANRDGQITGADWHDSANWQWTHGAWLPCNDDDDDSDGRRDNQDQALNGDEDLTDLAPVRIEWQTEITGTRLQITVNPAARPFVNLFIRNGSEWQGLDLSQPIEMPSRPFIDLRAEAKAYAHQDWDGRLRLQVTALHHHRILATAEAQWRVVPWLMLPNTAPVTDIYVRKHPEGENARFIEQLQSYAAVKGALVHLIEPSPHWQEMWMQDTMEIGYAQWPAPQGPQGHAAVLKANRSDDPPVDEFARELLAPQIGWLAYGEPRALPDADAWTDWYGNLEVTPPLPDYPLGRIYYGDSGANTLHPAVRRFLDAQKVQGPALRIDTSWLLIRHVDEILSFVEGQDGEVYVLLASPAQGLQLLRQLQGDQQGNLIFNRGLASEMRVNAFLNSSDAAHNADLQSKHIEPIRQQLMEELGLSASQIIDVPALFSRGGDALMPNLVNSLLVNGRILASDPKGPQVDGQDLFQQAFLEAIEPTGLEVAFLDDVYYHNHKGNSHCATNTLRQPVREPFWHFLPQHIMKPEVYEEDFAMVEDQLPNAVAQLIRQGEYSQARRQLSDLAAETADAALTETFRWQAERLRRIARDYSLNRDDVLRLMQERIADAGLDDLNRWLSQGRFDWRWIDGQARFMGSSVSNLFFRYPEIRARWLNRSSPTFQQSLVEIARKAMDPSHQSDPLVAPQRYHIRMTVETDPGAVSPGETVRCWIPFPQKTAFQPTVELLDASPEPVSIAPPDAPQRSVYFEQAADENGVARFRVEYEYVVNTRYDAPDPNQVTSFVPVDVRRYLEEQSPHVVFTPALIELTREIVGDAENPYVKARRIYEWIAHNIHYSYAREYSTLANISEYVNRHRYGDCGQIALLFITLCRIADVPARWESGWMLYPEAKNLHDWTVVYLHPYGWVPVDPNFGMAPYGHGDELSDEEKALVHEFYFGRITPYRLTANSAHGAAHTPPKRHWRSDTVDFQRGELETEAGNIYYGDFSYSLEILDRQPVTGEGD